MSDVNFRLGAAILLIGWYLITPLPLRAADGQARAPATADVKTAWYLMQAPLAPINSATSILDSTAPISRWRIVEIFRTKKDCDARGLEVPYSGARPSMPPWTRCISTDELAHARTIHATGWLLIMAPQDDAAAPLATWLTLNEPGDPEEPAYSINFPTKESCERYRRCLYTLCFETGSVIESGIAGWWPEMRGKWQRRRKSEASRCVPDDAPQFKDK